MPQDGIGDDQLVHHGLVLVQDDVGEENEGQIRYQQPKLPPRATFLPSKSLRMPQDGIGDEQLVHHGLVEDQGDDFEGRHPAKHKEVDHCEHASL